MPRDVADNRPTHEHVASDRERRRAAEELAMVRRKYDESLKTIARLEQELYASNIISQGVETFEIKPRERSGTSEGTVVWVASDWHVEERIDPRRVNGKNEYTLEIAKARAIQFFQGGLRLTQLLNQDIQIRHVMIPLLGDFISNDIHEEGLETAQLEPMLAISYARNLIASGIQYVLDNSDYEISLHCHSGNHARTTRKTRAATEQGHSLEYLMYLHLADYFRSEPRVKFVIADGYHSYANVYDTRIRFHHGHAIRYLGGVGGLTIPAAKAIAQWNRTQPVDLDVFGHFHQRFDGGNFLCNGSMIGFNAFAIAIKAAYEPPSQQLFLLDKKRGRTANWPILFDSPGVKIRG